MVQQHINHLLPAALGIGLSYLVFTGVWSWLCFLVAIGHLVHTYYRSLKITQMKGRGVVITGCDTGFGHQLAKRLHGFEFTVFACCLNDRSDGALALKKLGAETGRLHVIKMDVTNQKEVDAARDYVERNLPELGLWGVVNNAGFAYVGYIEWLPVENYEKMADVNIWGVVRVTNAFLPLIRKHQGRVVNVASVAGRIAIQFSGAYCITKFGVEAFSDILRLEMTRFNVGVSTIEPGNFLAATKLAGPSGIAQLCRQFWEQLAEPVRKDYGDNCVDEMIKGSEQLMKIASQDTSPIVDAMQDALIRRYPKSRYFVATLADKIVVYFHQFFPTFMSDPIILRFPEILKAVYGV